MGRHRIKGNNSPHTYQTKYMQKLEEAQKQHKQEHNCFEHKTLSERHGDSYDVICSICNAVIGIMSVRSDGCVKTVRRCNWYPPNVKRKGV